MINKLENISFQFSAPSFWVIIAGIAALVISVFVYRHTIVNVNRSVKTILISLRFLALFLLILLFFNLVIDVFFASESLAQNYIFIDNSRSIINQDSSRTKKKISELIDSLQTSQKSNYIYNTFDNDINEISAEKINSITYDGSSTSFENIFNYLGKTENNIASVVIISDGLINSGVNPLSSAGQLNYPVLTIGIGDTTVYDDLHISDLEYNDIIYAGKLTEIKVPIFNSSLNSISTVLELYQDNKLLTSKAVNLNSKSITEVMLNYTPESEGTKTLEIRLRAFAGENNTANNSKLFSVDVLNDKINTAIISGSPSVDASFILNSLAENDRFKVFSYTQIDENKFSEQTAWADLDNIDIVILSSFPSVNTPGNLIETVLRKIVSDNTPFLIQITNKTDLNKLSLMQNKLAFSASYRSDKQFLVQPKPADNIQYVNVFAGKNDWTNLPPINIPDLNIEMHENAIPLLTNDVEKSLGQSMPIIVLSEISPRSISLFGYNIWKWKLQTGNDLFFNSLIINMANWLNTDKELKKFRVSTDKRIYKFNDAIELSARVYDEILQPVDDATVTLVIDKQDEQIERTFDNIGNGQYRLIINSLPPGSYSYKAEARKASVLSYETSGSFIVDSVSAEELTEVADFNFLRTLSRTTNGEFYYIDSVNEIKKYIHNNPLNNSSIEYTEKTFEPKNYSVLMIIIISLFSLEWLIKKRIGLN